MGKIHSICIAGKEFSLAKGGRKMEEKLARAISLIDEEEKEYNDALDTSDRTVIRSWLTVLHYSQHQSFILTTIQMTHLKPGPPVL